MFKFNNKDTTMTSLAPFTMMELFATSRPKRLRFKMSKMTLCLSKTQKPLI